MRITRALDPVLGTPTKLRLVRSLVGAPARRRTGRELAKQAGVSPAQAARDLRDLLDVGVVNCEVHGRTFAWSWNSDHVLATPVAALMNLEASLRGSLVAEIAKGLRRLPIQKAVLFGSVARGEERADSDIDLFLTVRDEAQRKQVEDSLAALRHQIWVRFGNGLTALVYTSGELKRPANPALLKSIDSDGLRVDLEGSRADGEN